MRLHPVLLPAAVLAAAAVAAPAAAAAPWSAPVTISAPHTFVDDLTFADRATSTVARWRWQDGIGEPRTTGASFAARTAAGPFAPEVPIPDAADELLDVQGSGDGRLVALSQIQVRAPAPRTGVALYRLTTTATTAAGGFGAPKTLTVAPVLSLAQLAIAPGGRGAVAYITYEPESKRQIVHVALRSATGTFSKPQVISGRGQAKSVVVAANRRGDVVVAYVRNKVVYARVKRAGRGWGSIQTLTSDNGLRTQWQLRAAIDDSGSAAVLWRRRVLRQASGPGRRALEAVRLAAGTGRFGKRLVLESDLVSGGPSALVAVPGGFAVGYVSHDAAPGTLSTPRVIVLLSKSGTQFDVAPASGGVRDVRVAWNATRGLLATMVQPLPDGDSDGIGLGALLPPGSVDFGALEAVTPAENVHEVAPGFDSGGVPIAIWSARPDGTGPGIPIANIHSVVRAAARTG